MAVLGVKELPGVGRSLERRLAALGVLTCGDMQSHSLATLQVVRFFFNICFSSDCGRINNLLKLVKLEYINKLVISNVLIKLT